MYVIIFLVKVPDWPPIGKIAAHSAYEMFSWYRYLIVSLFFPTSGFWSGNLLLIAPVPDLCLLVPFCNASITCIRSCYIEAVSKRQNTAVGYVCLTVCA